MDCFIIIFLIPAKGDNKLHTKLLRMKRKMKVWKFWDFHISRWEASRVGGFQQWEASKIEVKPFTMIIEYFSKHYYKKAYKTIDIWDDLQE